MAPQHPPPTTASPCSHGGLGANCPITTSTMTTSAQHSHAYEPLFVGWIVGANENDNRGIEEGNGDDNSVKY